jgi:hypothetical protein
LDGLGLTLREASCAELIAQGDAMDEMFGAELRKVLHGSYRNTSDQMMLAVDTGIDASGRQGVELHEFVHSELSDWSSYGWFQRHLAKVSRHGPRELRGPARRAFDSSMAATKMTHEGLASLRQLAWILAHGTEGPDKFREEIPEIYQKGLTLALNMYGIPLRRRARSLDNYFGYRPAAFHVSIITLGLVVMNSPILTYYVSPDSISHSGDLPWISQNGPDDRFQWLLRHQDTIGTMLMTVLQRVDRMSNEEITDVAVHKEIYDYGIEYVQRSIPDYPVVTIEEHAALASAFKSAWYPYLNQDSDVQFIGQSGSRDVTLDRMLDTSYERSNQGEHEISTGRSIDLDFDSFISVHRTEEVAQVLRLMILAVLPPNPPEELFLDCTAGLVSVPMWTASVSEASPLVKFRPMYCAETPVRNLVQRSKDLSHACVAWYSNFSTVRSIRRLGIDLQGLIIEKCDSVRLLLAVAEQTTTPKSSHAIFRFGGECVVAVISQNTFSFSLSSQRAAEAFVTKVYDFNIKPHNGEPLRIGHYDVEPSAVARAALWSFVGK